MLGHQLLVQLRQNHEVKVTVRKSVAEYAAFGLFDKENTIDELDLRSTADLKRAIELYQPQMVVNAAGIVKTTRQLQRQTAKPGNQFCLTAPPCTSLRRTRHPSCAFQHGLCVQGRSRRLLGGGPIGCN